MQVVGEEARLLELTEANVPHVLAEGATLSCMFSIPSIGLLKKALSGWRSNWNLRLRICGRDINVGT